MKKNIIALVSLAIAFIGCTNIEPEPVVTPEPQDSHYSIKASIVNVTKTSIADDGAMAWIAGDKIDVYDGDFEEFTLVSEPTGAEAVFSGELYSPEDANIAFCPSGIGADVADEMLLFNLPASYEYDGQSTHAPMIATGFAVNAHEATISFKHIGGLFKITYNNVPEEATTFCFEASKQITGDLYMEDYTVNNPALAVGDNSEEGNIVTYSFSSGHPSTMSFYVPVPVGTFDFSISLLDATGATIAKSNKTKSNFTINRGDYVNIPAINMPKKLVENFTANVDDTQYGSSKSFGTAANISTYDYAWTLVAGSTATVGHDFVKTGKSGAQGYIQNSSMLDELATGTVFTVKVFAANWPNKATNLVVKYNEREYSTALTSAPTASGNDYNASDFKEYDFVFQKAEDINNFVVGGEDERVLIDKVVITEGGELPAEPQEFSVSTTSLSAAWDDTSVSFDITAADVVDWEIVADDGLTISQDEGTGNATITVTFEQNTSEAQVVKEIVVATEYSPVVDQDEYTITLTQAGKPAREMDGNGSAEKPYSIVDALYLINNLNDNGTTSEDVYIKGIIVGESAGIDTNYGNATFYLADSADSDDMLTAYRVKDLGNVNFTATDQLAVGNEVVVYAKLKKYVRNSEVTPETDQGYVYSINGATSILKSIAVNGQKTSFIQNEEWSFGGTVTASYRGKTGADVTSSTTFSGYNTANTGKQTVTASYTEDEVTKTTNYTISVVEEGAVQITKVTSVSQFTPGTYIILSYDESYYVPNAVMTNAGPEVKLVKKENGVINISRDMVWTATESTGGALKFESFVNEGNFLTGSSSNGGVRVKTNPDTSGDWSPYVNDTYGVLATATGSGSKYLATYGTQDWRNYQSVSTTNKAANFFKVVGWADPGAPKYTLTINSADNGSITASVDGVTVNSGAEIEEGKTVTITATPSSDEYVFDQWNVTGATVGTNATETFTMSNDVTVGATFKVKQSGGESKTLTLDKLGAGLTTTSNTTVQQTTVSSYTLNYLQGKKQGDAILLAKSTGAFISNKTPIPGKIKSVTVYINSGASSSTKYHCAFSTTECNEAYTEGSTAVNITGGNSNKYTCSVENASYFCISLGNTYNGQVLKLEIEYEQ